MELVFEVYEFWVDGSWQEVDAYCLGISSRRWLYAPLARS